MKLDYCRKCAKNTKPDVSGPAEPGWCCSVCGDDYWANYCTVCGGQNVNACAGHVFTTREPIDVDAAPNPA